MYFISKLSNAVNVIKCSVDQPKVTMDQQLRTPAIKRHYFYANTSCASNTVQINTDKTQINVLNVITWRLDTASNMSSLMLTLT